MSKPKFTFIDLFSGIGGFHAAMTAFGGKCIYSVEIDKAAAKAYQDNWGMNSFGDITKDANERTMVVPPHDVLCAGFPCQPFSKSGAQRGMEETRGTLYWNILRIIHEHKPSIVLLENVRNIAGPRHAHEWAVIISTLRDEGYRVSDQPSIFSPHLLPPKRGGRPQVRERVFITATRIDKPKKNDLLALPAVNNKPVDGWDPQGWNLKKNLPLESSRKLIGCELSDSEILWIDAWDEFVQQLREENEGEKLPGFPIWADHWQVSQRALKSQIAEAPRWKANFLIKNASLYEEHQVFLKEWLKNWGVLTDAFPPSRRKLEWQAQDTPRLWDTIMHLRPSGIRAKAPTYVPALVAITQTSIYGPLKRRLSVREAARLQGLPDWFNFDNQPANTSYRQLGNGVSVGAVWHVMREHVTRDEEILKITNPKLLRAVKNAPLSPDDILKELKKNGNAI